MRNLPFTIVSNVKLLPSNAGTNARLRASYSPRSSDYRRDRSDLYRSIAVELEKTWRSIQAVCAVEPINLDKLSR